MITEISDVERQIRQREKELELREDNKIFDEARFKLKTYFIFLVGALIMILLGIAIGVLLSEMNQNL